MPCPFVDRRYLPILITACLCECIALILKQAHWCTVIAISDQTLPVRYVSIPVALQYSQLYFCGTPFKSLFNMGFPTGVSFSFVLPLSIQRNFVTHSIRKGWVSSKEESSSYVLLTPRYLSIQPSSCKTKFSSPLWRDWINLLMQLDLSPMIMQSST
jgi:hypothetical protein